MALSLSPNMCTMCRGKNTRGETAVHKATVAANEQAARADNVVRLDSTAPYETTMTTSAA